MVKLTVNFDDPTTYHLYYGDGQGHPGTILTFFAWPQAMRGRIGTGQVTVTSCVVSEAAHHHRRALSEEKVQQRSQAAVTFARDRLSERSAVFEHFEVIRDALRHTHGRAQLPDIEAELARQKEQSKFIEVQHVRPNAPAARYTTPHLIEIEVL